MPNGSGMPRAKPRYEWRPQARADLVELVADIAEDNPDAAQELKDEIEAKAAKLPDHPKLYKASPCVKGMREMVVRSNLHCVLSGDAGAGGSGERHSRPQAVAAVEKMTCHS